MNNPNVVMKALKASGIAEKIKEYLRDAEQALDRYHVRPPALWQYSRYSAHVYFAGLSNPGDS